MKNSVLAKAVAVLVTVVLLAILFSQIDLADVVNTLAGIDPLYLVAGFLLYACSYFFRALRFHILLDKEVSMRDLFRIVCVHNMVNSILPARTGELSYVYLLKKVHQRKIGDGIATLVVARVFDFVIITLFFLFSLRIMRDAPPALMDTAWIGGVIMALVIVSLFLLLYSGRSFLRYMKYFFEKFHLVRWNIGGYILTKLEETVESLENIRASGSVRYAQLFFVSCGIWLSLYLLIYLLVLGMGISVGFLAVLFASTFSIVSTVLPVQGIGGFGTIEGAWTIGFMLVGVTKADAISSGFGYHVIIIIYFLIFGMYGFFMLKSRTGIISCK